MCPWRSTPSTPSPGTWGSSMDGPESGPGDLNWKPCAHRWPKLWSPGMQSFPLLQLPHLEVVDEPEAPMEFLAGEAAPAVGAAGRVEGADAI